jgi:hypothetical protein
VAGGRFAPAHDLLGALRAGMIVLADRNFAAQQWLAAVAATGADLLVRVKIGRNLPVCRRLSDGSYVSRVGGLEVRVITATITVVTDTGRPQRALPAGHHRPGPRLPTRPGPRQVRVR